MSSACSKNLAYLGKFNNHICINENTNILDLLFAFTSDHVNTTFHCNYPLKANLLILLYKSGSFDLFNILEGRQNH